MESQLLCQRPSPQRARSMWQFLPEEIMCMIADQFLDLEEPQNQDSCSEYPRPATLDLKFAQIDRRARSAFRNVFGKRQIMLEVNYNITPFERGSAVDQVVRQLSLFLPKPKYQHLCDRGNISVLYIGIGSSFPSQRSRAVHTSMIPVTQQNILQLSTFVQDHVSELPTITFLPQPLTKAHKNEMSQIIQNISNLTPHLRKADIAFRPCNDIVYNEDEISHLRKSMERTNKPVRNATDLIALFQPYQASLQNIVGNNTKILRCLIPVLTTILGVWDAFHIAHGRSVNWSEQIQGMNTFNIIHNLASITMRSVADFLLSQPNIAKHSRHFILIPGKITIQKHRGHNTWAENPAFQRLSDCIGFANNEFISLREFLSVPQQAQLITSHKLGQYLAVVQDEAYLELALARHKTIPGMMARYGKLRCDCEDQEACASMHATPGEHLERAKRRVALVREHSGNVERYRVEKGWIGRWLEAFDATAEKIEKGLASWKEGDEKEILREPMREFSDVEFVFQYAPEDKKHEI